jgi:hypothetical protein
MSDRVSGQPQFSADGRWWWDGRRWIGVPDAGHRPHPPSGVPPAEAAPRPSSPPLLGVIVVVVVLALVAVSGGVGVHRLLTASTTTPVRTTPRPAPTPSRSPAASSSTSAPATFAAASTSTLVAYLSSQHLVCGPPVPNGPNTWWWCSQEGIDFDTAGVGGRGPGDVLEVIGQVEDDRSSPDQNQARTFLASVAGIPYAGADPVLARSWVSGHMDGGTTFIGDVQFRIQHPSRGTWRVIIQPQTAG